MPLNIEFKARCKDLDRIRNVLKNVRARLSGIDHQTDTYFDVPSGRLKLRNGNVERSLIFYRRDEAKSPRRSDVWLAPCPEPGPMLDLLTAALGVRCVVEKRREIYFHEDAKIHVDEVPGLGSFVEVEVVSRRDEGDPDRMHASCRAWMQRLGIGNEDLIADGYADMIRTGSASSAGDAPDPSA